MSRRGRKKNNSLYLPKTSIKWDKWRGNLGRYSRQYKRVGKEEEKRRKAIRQEKTSGVSLVWRKGFTRIGVEGGVSHIILEKIS